jgi:hypothetical protein
MLGTIASATTLTSRLTYVTEQLTKSEFCHLRLHLEVQIADLAKFAKLVSDVPESLS